MKTIKNKQGVVLFIVVIYFLVLSLLLGGLFYLTIGNFNDQKTATEHSSAYYVAETGINLAMAQVEDELSALTQNENLSEANFNNAMISLTNTINGQIYDSSTTDSISASMGNASANLIASTEIDGSGYRVLTITSTGIVEGVERTLQKIIRFQYVLGEGNGFVIDKAILTKRKIDISLDSRILMPDGSGADVSTYSTVAGDVTISSATYLGDIYLLDQNPVVNDNVVDSKPSASVVIKTLEYKEFPIISFEIIKDKAEIVKAEGRTLPTLVTGNNTLNPSTGSYGGYYISNLQFNKNMTINVTGDILIVADRLTFGTNNRTINITGTGKLEIYIGNPNATTIPNYTSARFGSINNNVIFGNSENVKNLIIYVDSHKINNNVPTISLAGNNSIIYGSFMFNNASISFSNNCSFSGYLVTNGSSVILPNNGSLSTKGLVFAPLGTAFMLNNSVYRGSIVAENVNITKGTFTYDPLAFDSMPFVINDPINQIGYTSGYALNYEYDSTTEVD